MTPFLPRRAIQEGRLRLRQSHLLAQRLTKSRLLNVPSLVSDSLTDFFMLYSPFEMWLRGTVAGFAHLILYANSVY